MTRLNWLLLLTSGLLILAIGWAWTANFTARAPGRSAEQAAPFDQQFIDMMVPHHQGAVEMAKIARQRGQRPKITEMAQAIITSQEGEIAQMKTWRQQWFGSDQTPTMDRMPMVPGMGGAHGMHGGGATTMDMAADVEALRNAPEPFDQAFIDAMIPHHQSAIDAARAAETRAERAEIKDLARAIVADQQREIDQMKSWRQDWYSASSR